MVQLSCGLYVPTFRRDSDQKAFDELTSADIGTIRGNLSEAFGVAGAGFSLEHLPGAGAEPAPHSWLYQSSSFKALSSPVAFRSRRPRAGGEVPFPGSLLWPGRQPRHSQTLVHIRAQRAVDDPGCTDFNDWVVKHRARREVPQASARGLDDLQDFFAWHYACQRTTIFAAPLGDRVYHIWLPPGLLSPVRDDPAQGGPLAVLPLVTLVRNPYQLDWRHTIGISVLFVPVQSDRSGKLVPRPLVRQGSREVEYLTRSLEGGSTLARPSAHTHFQLEPSPLREYLDALSAQHRRPGIFPHLQDLVRDWRGTRRQWIEAAATIGADAMGVWDTAQPAHCRRLCGAVLRALRLSSVWSIALAGHGLTDLEARDGRLWPVVPSSRPGAALLARRASASRPRGLRDSADYALAGFPSWAANILTSLSRPGFPPSPHDRVDDVSCNDSDALTWRVPRRRCLLTMMGMSKEHFPDSSLLITSAWIGHMVIGAASATETMLELGRRISKQQPGEQLARTAYEFTLELEDMYDLDVTWLMYTRFFRSIRAMLGIDDQYKGIRERVDLLARATEVQERLRTERASYAIAVAGALLAFILIGLTAYTPDITNGWRYASIATAGVVLAASVYYYVVSSHELRRMLRQLWARLH